LKNFGILFLILFSSSIFAFEDPTKGKPFVPWLWEDQFYPTIKKAGEPSSLIVFGVGAGATAYSFSEDDDAQEWSSHVITEEQAQTGSILGGGMPGVGIAVIQLFVDQQNGLQHGRAIALTAATHISIAATVRRERPNKSPTKLSFPSGHASSIFATATSLAYSYGPIVGTLAYTAAVWNGISRIREEAHFASDVVAGAVIGIFWGRASALVKEDQEKSGELTYQIVPVPIEGGGEIVWLMDF
jgi:hypothetical protein